MTPTRYNHWWPLIIFLQVNCYSSIELNHLTLKRFNEISTVDLPYGLRQADASISINVISIHFTCGQND